MQLVAPLVIFVPCICLSRRQWRTAGRRFGDVAGECRMDLVPLLAIATIAALVRDE